LSWQKTLLKEGYNLRLEGIKVRRTTLRN